MSARISFAVFDGLFANRHLYTAIEGIEPLNMYCKIHIFINQMILLQFIIFIAFHVQIGAIQCNEPVYHNTTDYKSQIQQVIMVS